jgi:hypothetical protein
LNRPARRRASGPVTGGGTAALRGAVLIAVAVVVGVVLLGQGLDSGFVSSSNDDGDTATTQGNDNGGDDEGTTTTAAPGPRPAAQVTTWVLNGSGLQGVAGTNTDLLIAAGYATVPAANAAQDVPATIVYYAAGYEADAVAVTQVLGVASTAAQALPTPAPPAVPNGDIKGATVIIVLGPDIQNAQPPAATTTTG